MLGWRMLLMLGAVGVFGMWWGGHNVRLAIAEREPLEISCADYLANKPAAHYLRLTGCEPDLDNIAEETEDREVKTVYVPLRPAHESGAPHIVLVRDDAAIRKFAASSERGGEPTVEDGDVIDSLYGPQQGVVSFGIDLSEDTRSKLEGLGLGLADDFVLLDEGAEPHLWWGLLACTASLLALGRLAEQLVRRFRG
jgi:hypothetical protein